MQHDGDKDLRRNQKLPKFTLTLITRNAQGGQQIVELKSSGELWVSEQDASGNTMHRQLVRTFTLAHLHELWGLIESSGLSQGPDQQFGSGPTSLTFTLMVDGRTVRWRFGADVKTPTLPVTIQQLLQSLGPLEMLKPFGFSLQQMQPSQIRTP